MYPDWKEGSKIGFILRLENPKESIKILLELC